METPVKESGKKHKRMRKIRAGERGKTKRSRWYDSEKSRMDPQK